MYKCEKEKYGCGQDLVFIVYIRELGSVFIQKIYGKVARSKSSVRNREVSVNRKVSARRGSFVALTVIVVSVY